MKPTNVHRADIGRQVHVSPYAKESLTSHNVNVTGKHLHAGHTRKASRISKAALDNCDKGVGNFYLS